MKKIDQPIYDYHDKGNIINQLTKLHLTVTKGSKSIEIQSKLPRIDPKESIKKFTICESFIIKTVKYKIKRIN